MQLKLLLLVALLLLINSILQAQKQTEIEVGFDWVSLEEAEIEAANTGKKILIFGYASGADIAVKLEKHFQIQQY